MALACLLAGSALAIVGTARDAKRESAALAELVARQLDAQLSRIGRSADIPARFPDWDLVASIALQPGQCIELRGLDGDVRRSSCAGLGAAAATVPTWFLAAHHAITGGAPSADRPITYRGAPQGTLSVRHDPQATAAKSWATIAPLMSLSAAIVAILCFVAYVVIDRALRPAQDILSGLNRLARGDLACRLPEFRLAELNRISQVFNALSEDLNKANIERAELARRLVDTQEQERRHIARELHDDIAQRLSALSAHAAFIRTRAQSEAPGLAGGVREIEGLVSALMKSLRRTLTYLRPQEIDDLGIVQSLKSLVAQYNEASRGRTFFSIETAGEVERLSAESSAHVYRIVQEALTNASKHANARNVLVQLSQTAGHDRETIMLSVIDDGSGSAAPDTSARSGGSGMIGMRERVAALSGKFAAGPLPDGGFRLHVEFPVSQGGA